MAWLAVDKDGSEWIHEFYPTKSKRIWFSANTIQLQQGTIKKLIGRELTWNEEPVELK